MNKSEVLDLFLQLLVVAAVVVAATGMARS